MPRQPLRRSCHHRSLVVVALFLVCATLMRAQTAIGTKPATPDTNASAAQKTDPAAATAPLSPKELRDAQIAADTQKLYQLAQELKAEVAKSTKDTLSLSVIKKASEVEKLAHTLKEQLKKQ